MDDALRIVIERLGGAKKTGGQWMARCPVHEDATASLSVGVGTEHPVVFSCMAGCDSSAILDKLKLTWPDLCQPREDDGTRREDDIWTPNGPALARYQYHNETGKLLFEVLRSRGKKFSQRVPDAKAKSGWSYRLGDTRRVLFHLPKLIADTATGMDVWLVEGEKDVLAIEAQGCTATCNPGGAGKWREEYSEFLRETVVHIVADRDEPGQRHARQVYASLLGVAACVEIVEAAGEGLPDGTRIKDAADHLAAGFKMADFVVTRSEDDDEPDLAPDLHEFLAVQDEPYDWLIHEILERGDRLVWTGTEGSGKALALDTPIPTPKGWTTMGELSPGDEVFGSDGRPARVTMATPVMTGHDCYRVTFSDGAQIVADAQHRWLTETLAAREAHQKYARKSGPLRKRGTDQKHKRLHFPAVVTTEQIRDTLTARDGHAVNHSIETCQPLRYPAQELPIGPYTLGAWLGDGTSRNSQITCCDDDAELLDYIRTEGYAVERRGDLQYLISNRPERERRISAGLELARAGMGAGAAAAHVGVGRDALAAHGRPTGHRATLREAGMPPLGRYRTVQGMLDVLGVLGSKHIPRMYLESSASQRLALLQGLMDTDGTVSGEGAASGRGSGAATCEFSVVSERLARDVHELLLGLGIKVKFRTGNATLNGRRIGDRYRLSFQTELPVFRLRRKAERLTPLRTRRAKLRYIASVEPVESVPVRCISVDNSDHLFLAGRECIPTHNSVTVRILAVALAAGLHPFRRAQMSPGRVLFIDCENSERKTRKHFRGLEQVARLRGRRVPDGNLRIICKPQGVNLLSEDGAAWLMERVTAHKPDLLCIGPFYRLHEADMNDERAARMATVILDQARAKTGCAIVTEAHAPHGEGPIRPVRPVGSSLLMRWPELGMGIRPAPNSDRAESGHKTTMDVVMWRGPRDDEYRWPTEITWGTHEDDWPWTDSSGPRLHIAPPRYESQTGTD